MQRPDDRLFDLHRVGVTLLQRRPGFPPTKGNVPDVSQKCQGPLRNEVESPHGGKLKARS